MLESPGILLVVVVVLSFVDTVIVRMTVSSTSSVI